MKLVQDTGEPWSHFCACILLNRATAVQAEQALKGLLARWPTPQSLAAADQSEVALTIRGCGLQNMRASSLKRMSRAFRAWNGADPTTLPGLGPYASDSYRILFLKDPTVRPADKVLRKYLEQKEKDEAVETDSIGRT